MRVLMQYHQNYGRMGSLDALFVVDEVEATKISELDSFWLSDILGKHSEVEITPADCKIVLRENTETKAAFDALSVLDIGISGDFIDRARNPDYYD